MEQTSSFHVCRRSATRIKSLLGSNTSRLLSLPPLTSEMRLCKKHKCDAVKLPQIISQMSRLHTKTARDKKPPSKQREIHLPDPFLTRVHQEVLMTQCSVNQKYMHQCLEQEAKNPALLQQRSVQCGFREYFFAYKRFKELEQQTIVRAKKYQIDLLKDEHPEEWPKDLHPVKTEERHFRIAHTIKHS